MTCESLSWKTLRFALTSIPPASRKFRAENRSCDKTVLSLDRARESYLASSKEFREETAGKKGEGEERGDEINGRNEMKNKWKINGEQMEKKQMCGTNEEEMKNERKINEK